MNAKERARNYIDKMPPAISGENGDKATFRVACVLWHGFALGYEDTLELLRHYNRRCKPPWSEQELQHKASGAAKTEHDRPRGHLLTQERIPNKRVSRGIPTNHGKVLGYFSPLPEDEGGSVKVGRPNPSEGAQEKPSGQERQFECVIETEPNRSNAEVIEDENDSKEEATLNAPHSARKRNGYRLITERERFAELAAVIKSSGCAVAVDIETYGPGKDGALDPRKGDIRLLQVAFPGEIPWIIDLQKTGYDLGPLKEALEKKAVIAHNAKFDLGFLKEKCGVCYPEQVFCTLTASKILTAGTAQNNDLGAVLRRYKIAALPKEYGKSNWSVPALTAGQMEYAVEDVVYLHDLAEKLRTDLENAGLSHIFELEMRLLPVVLKMERTGFAVDKELIEEIREKTNFEAEEWKTELLKELGDEDLNPNSHAKLLEAFKSLGAELPDTREETIKGWRGSGQEACRALLKYRRATKRVQQCASLLKCVGPDGRIRASFNPLGADTARFSCREPNLQNIAKGPLRGCFVAAPGRRIICADYSQIELRIAAAITGEDKMLEAYRDGRDLHRLTAANTLGKAEEDVTSDDRQLAKAVNFGLLFGQGAPGLQRYAESKYGIRISEGRAVELRKAFFDAYPELRDWHNAAHNDAGNYAIQEIETRLGRRRLLPAGSANEWKRFAWSVNTPVQGGAADGLKKALILLDRDLPGGANIVSTVHDEIIVEAPEDAVEACCGIVKRSMEEAMSEIYPEVPILVEPAHGATWADAK